MNRQKAWNVYRICHNGSLTLVDTVYYDPDCTSDYVKRTLVEHDGYPADIVVLYRD